MLVAHASGETTHVQSVCNWDVKKAHGTPADESCTNNCVLSDQKTRTLNSTSRAMCVGQDAGHNHNPHHP